MTQQKKKLPSQDYLKTRYAYDAETGTFTHICGIPAGSYTSRGYIQTKLDGIMYTVHRLIWKYMTNEEPDQIDHINRIKDDNRWCNLRSVSNTTNIRNRATFKNSTGVSGVRYRTSQDRWLVEIHWKGKKRHIGSYINALDAIQSRIEAEEIFWDKSHAHTNKEFKDRLRQHLLRGH